MFVICCDNKKCGKSQEPLLDKVTNEVFCSECGSVITNVTEFAKNSMRSLSQFKRTTKTQQAFAVKCNGCNKTAQPKLSKTTAAMTLVCPHCGREHDGLQAPYAHAIKQYLLTNPVNSGIK
ncbi:MAG TPA: hypothetical protein VI423_10590 [Paenisporosarcina sp.]|nr:hypothetical protein [Paenisporosarcina sp.]